MVPDFKEKRPALKRLEFTSLLFFHIPSTIDTVLCKTIQLSTRVKHHFVLELTVTSAMCLFLPFTSHHPTKYGVLIQINSTAH